MYTNASNTCLALFQMLKIKAWQKVNKTRKCSIASETHIRSHNHVSFKNYFCKPIAITLDIILYEFIVSRVYGHTISLYPSEYINSETMSHIIIFVMKQINLTLQLFV